MEARLRAQVQRRALFRCEYCHLAEIHAPFAPFQMEHIIPRQHRGTTKLNNLAWSCSRCNLQKGPNLASLDEIGQKLTKLFHPRRMKWDRHFRRIGPWIRGRTAIGRITVELLQMNNDDRIELRRSLLEEGIDLDQSVAS